MLNLIGTVYVFFHGTNSRIDRNSERVECAYNKAKHTEPRGVPGVLHFLPNQNSSLTEYYTCILIIIMF